MVALSAVMSSLDLVLRIKQMEAGYSFQGGAKE
jgi:hypothetical protein